MQTTDRKAPVLQRFFVWVLGDVGALCGSDFSLFSQTCAICTRPHRCSHMPAARSQYAPRTREPRLPVPHLAPLSYSLAQLVCFAEKAAIAGVAGRHTIVVDDQVCKTLKTRHSSFGGNGQQRDSCNAAKRAEIANASAGPCISPGAKGRVGCQLPHPVASMFGCRSRSRTQVAPIEQQCAIDFSTTWGGGEATMARKRRMWCSFARCCFR